jgi:hypothetical protein
MRKKHGCTKHTPTKKTRLQTLTALAMPKLATAPTTQLQQVITGTHLCCTSASLRPTPREDFLRVGGKAASITITLYPFCRAALESVDHRTAVQQQTTGVIRNTNNKCCAQT